MITVKQIYNRARSDLRILAQSHPGDRLSFFDEVAQNCDLPASAVRGVFYDQHSNPTQRIIDELLRALANMSRAA